MENNNNNKNSHLVFFIMMFIVAVFFELYWINTRPYDYFMLIGIGLVVLITGFLTFDGIIKARSEAEELRREQNETMIKAQKAIYLAAKKNAAEAESMQIQSLKAVNILMDRMVETITERQIGVKSNTPEQPVDLSALISEMSASNARLAKEVQNAVTVNQLVKANADLIKNVQNVLNGQAVNLEIQTDYASAKPVLTPVSDVTAGTSDSCANTAISDAYSASSFSTAASDTLTSYGINSANMSDNSLAEAAGYDNAADISYPAANGNIESTSDDIINIDDITLEELNGMDSMDSDISQAEAAVADASQTVEAMEAAELLEADIEKSDESVTDDMDNDKTLADAAAAMEKGPNDALSPDEIAALFANL